MGSGLPRLEAFHIVPKCFFLNIYFCMSKCGERYDIRNMTVKVKAPMCRIGTFLTLATPSGRKKKKKKKKLLTSGGTAH